MGVAGQTARSSHCATRAPNLSENACHHPHRRCPTVRQSGGVQLPHCLDAELVQRSPSCPKAQGRRCVCKDRASVGGFWRTGCGKEHALYPHKACSLFPYGFARILSSPHAHSYLVFASSTGRTFQIEYPSITLHAIQRSDRPSIYCQLDESEEPSASTTNGATLNGGGDADEEEGGEEQEFTEMRELNIIPPSAESCTSFPLSRYH